MDREWMKIHSEIISLLGEKAEKGYVGIGYSWLGSGEILVDLMYITTDDIVDIFRIVRKYIPENLPFIVLTSYNATMKYDESKHLASGSPKTLRPNEDYSAKEYLYISAIILTILTGISVTIQLLKSLKTFK